MELNKSSIPFKIISPDCLSCKLKQVSNTSEDVIPLCKNLPSFPDLSIIELKKAITSCLTLPSIFKILFTSIFDFDLTFL